MVQLLWKFCLLQTWVFPIAWQFHLECSHCEWPQRETVSEVARDNPMEEFEYQDRALELQSVFNVRLLQGAADGGNMFPVIWVGLPCSESAEALLGHWCLFCNSQAVLSMLNYKCNIRIWCYKSVDSLQPDLSLIGSGTIFWSATDGHRLASLSPFSPPPLPWLFEYCRAVGSPRGPQNYGLI